MSGKIKAGVVGATGYAGAELTRLMLVIRRPMSPR